MHTLILIDVQKEYTSPTGPLRIASIGPSLENLQAVLQHARKEEWPVIHVKHIQQTSERFHPQSGLTDIIEGFEPRSKEGLQLKSRLSAYSSNGFREDLDATDPEQQFVVVGYGSSMCCLATIVDGFNRGHKFKFVHDASASRSSEGMSEEEMHGHACAVMKTFAKVLSTAQLLEETRSSQKPRATYSVGDC